MEVELINNLYKQSYFFFFLKCHFICLHFSIEVLC